MYIYFDLFLPEIGSSLEHESEPQASPETGPFLSTIADKPQKTIRYSQAYQWWRRNWDGATALHLDCGMKSGDHIVQITCFTVHTVPRPLIFAAAIQPFWRCRMNHIYRQVA